MLSDVQFYKMFLQNVLHADIREKPYVYDSDKNKKNEHYSKAFSRCFSVHKTNKQTNL